MLPIAYFLMGTNEVHALSGLLRDDDRAVVKGAVALCWGFGLAAREAEGTLLGILEHAPGADVRLQAASAIGAVGGEGCLPELRRISSRQQSPELREAIRAAVSLIALEDL
jgi:HEAT repeat protein